MYAADPTVPVMPEPVLALQPYQPMPEPSILPTLLIGAGIIALFYYAAKSQPRGYSRRDDGFWWGMMAADSMHDHHGGPGYGWY
jgi:hypothetical protein